MSHVSNRATVLLLPAVILAVALASSGCRNKTPPEPASPPKPKLESQAVQPFAGLRAMPMQERTVHVPFSSRRDIVS